MASPFFLLLITFSIVVYPLNVSAKPEKSAGISLNDKLVSGKVTDAASGKPLSGATVSIKGTNNSTTTNVDGFFSINVKDNSVTLVFTYVGYISKEVPVGGNSTIDVALNIASAQLAEVVIGYGTQSKKDVTGSVKSLQPDDFNKGIINSPEQLLQGKVAGVNVTSANGEPGAVQSITVRGPGGVRTGSTPLFVLDGLALDNSSTGGGNPLNFLNPQDIASIDVLKDASATAIYGARGANGVILITTKRGKSGSSTLSYVGSLAISHIARKLPVFSADKYKEEVVALGGELDDKGTSTDWQDVITRIAITQNHNLTLSGGANKLTYYASFGLQNQQGIIKHNDFKRYTGRFNATQRFLEDRLIIEANMTATSTYDLRPDYGTVIGSAISNNPTYPAYDSIGNPAQYQNINNPLQSFKLDEEITKINRVIGNITATVKIVKGLSYKLNFGIDNSTGTRDVQALPSLVPQRDGRLETYYTTNTNTLFENYLTYNTDWGNHSLTALAGQSYQKIFLQGRNYSINKFPISPVEPQYNPGIGQELTLANNKPGGYALINELQSFFGRVNYQYQNKYLITATLRADGSSKFGGNNKYGYFPSFSLGWKINDESFMANSGFDILKLRAGWGQTGNQEIPSKITQALFTSSVSSSSSYPFSENGPYPSGTIYTRLANPNIQWEVSTQTNIGLDFGFLNGKLNGSIDVFNKNTNNILLQVIPADPIQPANTVWTNVKDMNINNKGIELDLEYRVRNTNGFSYGISGNFTALSNKVTHSPYSVIPSGSASGSGLTSATINGYINDQPIGTFFLKEFTGFDQNGLSVYRDVDGDGTISDNDRIAAGTALPNVLYSFNLNLGYKGFDFAANFNGVSGNKIYDNTANSNFYKLKLFKGLNTTPEAIKYPQESVNNAAPVSTRFLKDGAYLRLNNLSLGYNFDVQKLHISQWAKVLRLSVTGQNIFVITKYDGYDPEVNADRQINGVLSYGIDFLSYPKARSIIFGLNVTF
ncbi:TonB-dependent receptor [Hanamia caeni]|uniref:TonB-dependent receptor n=2 Tax=Hanamia caeni TaxID=2294116 RepID=A0A3M9N7Y0_9BACT|nr:TonB-dependent receptor [Hanamia caeni]